MGVGIYLYAQHVRTKNKQQKSTTTLQCHPHSCDFCSRPRLTQPYNHTIYPGVSKMYPVSFWKCHSYPLILLHCGSKKNAPTLADYNYNPVQSILIIFSKLFVNDHKNCLVVKFSTSPHMCCHYTLWNTMLYFALITLLIARNAPTSDHRITSISVKEF